MTSTLLDARTGQRVQGSALFQVRDHQRQLRPAFRYSVTRDLHVRLSEEMVPADRTLRGSVLLSWNIAPKSWLHLVWNEYLETGTGLPLLDRNAAVKLRYLFYFQPSLAADINPGG